MIDAQKLNALVDGELDSKEAVELSAQVANDDDAARELGAIHMLKDAVRESVKPVPCEDEWKRCVGRLNEIDKARRTDVFVGKYAWAICSLMFAMIVGAGILNRSNPSAHLGSGELAQMQASLSPVRLPSRVENWISGLFGKSPEIATNKLQIVEGYEGQYAGRRVAQLKLRDDKGDLTLYVVAGQVAVEGAVQLEEGYIGGEVGRSKYVGWTDQGLFLMLVGDRSTESLQDLAKTVRGNR